MIEELTIKVEKMDQFSSKADWIKRAQRVFAKKKPAEQWNCFDKYGNHLIMGRDFIAAEKLETYPVGVYRLIKTSQKQIRIDEEAAKAESKSVEA